MTTRAKFVCNSVTVALNGNKQNPETKQWEQCMTKTIAMSPVFGNGDPDHENTKFWNASPTGRFELGVINLPAAAMFEPGKEYYIDITAAN